MDLMELSSDITKFRRDAQCLRKENIIETFDFIEYLEHRQLGDRKSVEMLQRGSVRKVEGTSENLHPEQGKYEDEQVQQEDQR